MNAMAKLTDARAALKTAARRRNANLNRTYINYSGGSHIADGPHIAVDVPDFARTAVVEALNTPEGSVLIDAAIERAYAACVQAARAEATALLEEKP